MPVLALLVVSAMADGVDLPVATQGTEQWAGVVAKAMTVGGRSQAESMQAMQSFQDLVMQKMGKTVHPPGSLPVHELQRCCASDPTKVINCNGQHFGMRLIFGESFAYVMSHTK